ncbi:Uma2 family endonuclease [Nonomuraea turcica]|uniref:Uma2 family endonuclease n=1 Tax=Nonomuraea sp. G32 TaxID=3067274 RepID=UPI00273BD662|nr:Uma2 family endonuclease [Nonomuraea sp. G32]MDP4508103.1 Uma2 family endonuclease [Nonomuraea sp. G32]
MTSEAPEPLPDWVRPPPHGFAAEDLDRLPGLPMHAELIDGSLVFFAPQTAIHSCAVSLFQSALDRAVPKDLLVVSRMTVILDEDQRPEPDVMVIRASGWKGWDQTYFRTRDVVLAIEIVSRDTRSRDRKRKPLLYAEAGIPHFWRAETETGELIVHVYDLDPITEAYALTSVRQSRLKLAIPFDVDIDLTEIHRL